MPARRRPRRRSAPPSAWAWRSAGSTAALHRFEPPQDLEHQRVLVDQMLEDRADLSLGPLADLEISVRAELSVSILKVLSDHDQRHQVQLEQIADEKPDREGGARIEFFFLRAAPPPDLPPLPPHDALQD